MAIFFTRINYVNQNFFFITEKVKVNYRCVRIYEEWIEAFNLSNSIKDLIINLNQTTKGRIILFTSVCFIVAIVVLAILLSK